jgi:ceramide glucosyltransferase
LSFDSEFAGANNSRPLVSILKPISGLEDGLEHNLASFARIEGVSYEVIFSIADVDDPALEVVRNAIRAFPEAPFRLVVGGVMPGLVANPKVERLISASRLARGAIFLISDANVRVQPDDVARIVATVQEQNVGLVTTPFIGEGARSSGSIIESLHLLTFVLPGTYLAEAIGKVCVVGKSMAISRKVCDEIGGFERFAAVLAEDQAMGLAVRNAGYRVAISPVIVRNVTEQRTLSDAIARQIRWAKIRYSFSRRLYLLELFGQPFALALLALMLTLIFQPMEVLWLLALCLVSLAARQLQVLVLSRIIGGRLSVRHFLLAPLQELLQLVAHFSPYISNEVVWRGHRARLGPGSVMLPSRFETEARPALEG